MAKGVDDMILIFTIIVFSLSGGTGLWSLWLFIDWAAHGFPQRFEQ
jgi:hypothetical protein